MDPHSYPLFEGEEDEEMGLWRASFRKSKLAHLDIVASCKHNFVLIHLLSVIGILSLKIFTLSPGARIIHGGGYKSA